MKGWFTNKFSSDKDLDGPDYSQYFDPRAKESNPDDPNYVNPSEQLNKRLAGMEEELSFENLFGPNADPPVPEKYRAKAVSKKEQLSDEAVKERDA